MPGFSLNCLRTSMITYCAAWLTARMASAEQPAHEDLRLGDVDRLDREAVVAHLVQVGREEEEGGERRGADRVALGEGLGGVADRVEPVGLLADVLGLVAHLDDAARVVGDRAKVSMARM